MVIKYLKVTNPNFCIDIRNFFELSLSDKEILTNEPIAQLIN